MVIRKSALLLFLATGTLGMAQNTDTSCGIYDAASISTTFNENGVYRQTGVVVPGSRTSYSFAGATEGTYAELNSGNVYAEIIGAYHDNSFANVTAVGRLSMSTGPDGTQNMMLQPQYYTTTTETDLFVDVGQVKPAGPTNYAFRVDRFDINSAKRKFVIEYDYKIGGYLPNDLYNNGVNDGSSRLNQNEFGVFLSNGKRGVLTSGARGAMDSDYSAIGLYKLGAYRIRNTNRAWSGDQSNTTFYTGAWYRVRTEYILTSETTMTIIQEFHIYENGRLKTFADSEVATTQQGTPNVGGRYTRKFNQSNGIFYYHKVMHENIPIDLAGTEKYLVDGFQAGVMADSTIDNVDMYWVECDLDSDGDGIPDRLDADDDNDGILDVVEAFACGIVDANAVSENFNLDGVYKQKGVAISGTRVSYDFTNANDGGYAVLNSGNASAGIIGAYHDNSFADVKAVGRLGMAEGPDGTQSMMLQPQYYSTNTEMGLFVDRGVTKPSGPTNYAFREDRFDLNSMNRKFVIEYDYKVGGYIANDPYNNSTSDGTDRINQNEFGVFLSNGKRGVLTSGARGAMDSDYAAIGLYKLGAHRVRNANTVRSGDQNNTTFYTGAWYRVRTEYILTSETTMTMIHEFHIYENGRLKTFADSDISTRQTGNPQVGGSVTRKFNQSRGLFYYHKVMYDNVPIDLAGTEKYLVDGFQAGVMTDSSIDNVVMYWAECDTDEDGIPNRLDLDSDNDGCADALEGGNDIRPANLVDAAGVLSDGNNGVVNKNLGNTIDANGIPTIVGASGQTAGSSSDANIKGRYCACYKDAIIAGDALNTNHGITLLKRAGDDNDGDTSNDWPMLRKGAWTALESNTKGFVITRMTTAEIESIASPQEGMMTYDTTLKCLKIYDGASWKCFNTTGCPSY